jgi:hypothetical protein
MTLGELEPDLWIPASHPAARLGSIDLGELASLDVIHGPRRAEPGTYDPWTSIVRAMNPRFEFTEPTHAPSPSRCAALCTSRAA